MKSTDEQWLKLIVSKLQKTWPDWVLELESHLVGLGWNPEHARFIAQWVYKNEEDGFYK